MPGAFDVPVRVPDQARPDLRGRAWDDWLPVVATVLIAAGAVVLVWALGQRPWDQEALLRLAVVALAVALGALTAARERALGAMAAGLRAERARVVELEHRLEQAVGVDAAVRALSAAVETDEVADAILAEAVRLLDADDATVLLVDDDGRLAVAAGAAAWADRGVEVAPGEGAAGWVAAHRRSLLLDRPCRGEHFAGMAPGRLESAAAVPLLAGEQLVGVLAVGTAERGRRFDPGDLFTLELLADHAAFACSTARQLADERASLVALSQAERRRADQIAMVTHDLKTPLTSLIGYLNLLRKRGERGSSIDRATFYKHMDRQARRMLEMVEDLLVSSTMEHPGRSLEREPLDLPAIVEEIRALFAGRAPDRAIEVSATPVATPVYGDRAAVAHVLQNLVDNALKYSPPDSVVRVEVDDHHTQVLLTVTDAGQGIPASERTGIFERFRRASRSGPRGSVGLGLHVVKSLVTAHGGRVWCESEPGQGSSFYVTLPRRVAAEPVPVGAGTVPSGAEPLGQKGPT